VNATKERQAWCCLQVKLCDPCLSALDVPWCEKALYKCSSFPFLSTRYGCACRACFGDSLVIMTALCNRGPLYFCPVISIFLSSIFVFPRLISAATDWIYFYTWRGPSANLECRSEMCCSRLAENTGRKKVAKIAI